MKPRHIKGVFLLIFALIISLSTPAFCDDFSKVEKSFKLFNQKWMSKLHGIEKGNIFTIKNDQTLVAGQFQPGQQRI